VAVQQKFATKHANENRMAVAFSIESNSGMNGGDLCWLGKSLVTRGSADQHVAGTQSTGMHIGLGESETIPDGKKSSANLHILMNWQK
jgi:hypothetical protein